MSTIPLEPEQEELFVRLVETLRNVPREKRESFAYIWLGGGRGDLVDGNGVRLEVLGQDVQVLVNSDLLNIEHYQSDGRSFTFFVPPTAFAYYEELKRQGGEPTSQVEQEIRTYLDAAEFRSAFPAAYARWSEAADLLWQADSERELSTIGHKCREAIQEFVTALIEKHQPPEVNSDMAMTRDRFSAVLKVRRSDLGDKRSAVLNDLFDFWRSTGDLVQRQEHQGQKEGEPLVWEDGRRVVFLTAVLMFEAHRAL